MRRVATLAAAEGLHAVLLVDAPEPMLLDLKMARDLGLRAAGSPATTGALDMQDVVRATFAYWGYVLLGG